MQKMEFRMISIARRSPRFRRLVAVAATGAVGVVLLLTGCGAGQPAAQAAAPAPQAAAPAAAMEAAPTQGAKVEVVMTEYALALPRHNFSPGTYTFVAVNSGQYPHTITIIGPGVANRTASGALQSGQSASLTVDLQRGTYDIWCPVGNHRAMGMATTIKVA
jgi:plastocyanin